MTFRAKYTKKIDALVKDDEKTKIIEKNIFDWCLVYSVETNIQPTNFKNVVFKSLYTTKVKQVCHNITHHIGKKITLDNIHVKTYKELCPGKWKKFSKDLEILNKKISDFDSEVTTTDQFQCSKCHKRKCCYTSFQIRSSDEPMTNFITCIECGYNWRE